MFTAISSLLKAMEIGKEVANPALMKNRQLLGNKIGLLILALLGAAKAIGYDLPIDKEAALLIGGGIAAVWNIVFTYATSKKVGLRSKRQAIVHDEHEDGPADTIPPDDRYFG